jgi:TIR domain
MDVHNMNVFIGWSGKLSHGVALALYEWLPCVIQTIRPYISSEDIDKGTQWMYDLSTELTSAKYGILCITPDNSQEPWINFEAGALFKSLDHVNVMPFLFRVKPTDIKKGPLTHFQSTAYDQADVRKLIRSLNNACAPRAVEEAKLERTYEKWWPDLQAKLDGLDAIAATAASISGTRTPRRRTVEDLVTEILEDVRSQRNLLSEVLSNSPTSNNVSSSALREINARWQDLWEYLLRQEQALDPDALRDMVIAIGAPLEYIMMRFERSARNTSRTRSAIAREFSRRSSLIDSTAKADRNTASLPLFEEGATVHHPHFGNGSVIQSSLSELRIRFDDDAVGVKIYVDPEIPVTRIETNNPNA